MGSVCSPLEVPRESLGRPFRPVGVLWESFRVLKRHLELLVVPFIVIGGPWGPLASPFSLSSGSLGGSEGNLARLGHQ